MPMRYGPRRSVNAFGRSAAESFPPARLPKSSRARKPGSNPAAVVRFLPLASEELDEAIDFYEARSPGLGARFLDEVKRAVSHLELFPQSGSPILHRQVPAGTRKLALKTFPFSIVYSEPELTVVAVAHQE